MRVNPQPDSRQAGGFKTFAAQPRRIEKSSAASGLGTRQQDDAPSRPKAVPRLQVELVCQDDTACFDPFRDAPRLVPAFVAQVLGQAMPEPHDRVSVETAYGKAAPRPAPKAALLVDRKS